MLCFETKWAMLAFVGIILVFGFSPTSSTAFSEQATWQTELRKQLQFRHDCELNYLTDIRAFELRGRQTVKARAHCMDKRAFDVTRMDGEQAFKVQSCSVIVC